MPASSSSILTIGELWTIYSALPEETKALGGFTKPITWPTQSHLTLKPACRTNTQPCFYLTARNSGRKHTCPLPGPPHAGALTHTLPWPPQENPLLSPNSQVQWQVHHRPLTNVHVKAVINLLESELPPPPWAIFQPFSGIIIRDRDVNISSPEPRKWGRGSNLGEFPAGSCSGKLRGIGFIR